MKPKILYATESLEKYGDIIGFLKQRGFPLVITATNGDEVLKILENDIPDFAIFDVDLPILDGFQLCRIMKTSLYKQCEDVPVVLLSENNKFSISSLFTKIFNIFSILQTPFSMDDLLHLINKKFYPEKCFFDRSKKFLNNITILMVSNDTDTIALFKQCLRESDDEIYVVSNEKEIPNILPVINPTIIFLDHTILQSNGYFLWKQKKESFPETIVIIITTSQLEPKAIELMKIGASDFVVKPLDKNIISHVLKKALIRHNMLRAEKHINEMEIRCRSMVEAMIDGVILLDSDGKTVMINKAGSEMFRYLDIKQANDDTILSISHINTNSFYTEILTKQKPYVTYKINTNNNEEKHFVVVASPVKGHEGKNIGIVIVIRDVTKEYLLKNKVVKSERLFAVSNLVAGAAHELNNPLAGIQLCTELVLNDPSISEKAMKYLSRVQKETEQIQDVVKSLLTFTGNYTLSKVLLNINEIIEDIIKQKTYQFDHAHIKVTSILNDLLPFTNVDRHQIRRVLLNIIENACAVMEGQEKEKCLTIQTEEYKKMVRITITDTGPGISKEYLPKIFEPFFTKGANKNRKNRGTGLGLSIAHSIINQHNGNIYVKSELEQGSSFIIELPAS